VDVVAREEHQHQAEEEGCQEFTQCRAFLSLFDYVVLPDHGPELPAEAGRHCMFNRNIYYIIIN
jgi:hypothetical protein